MPSTDEYAARLLRQLNEQKKHARTFDDYYTGERRLAIVEREYADIFGVTATSDQVAALTPPDTNVAAVGVDALSERLQVESWGLAEGTAGTVDAAEAERSAAAFWEGSDLDVMQSVANVEALVKGRSFLRREAGPDGQTASVEDPEQVAVIRDHAPPYAITAAIKVAANPWGGADLATLWVPGRRLEGVHGPDGFRASGGGVEMPGPVPLYELAYRQRLIAEPRSYIAPIASMADSYALLMAYLVIAARFGAVPLVTMAGVTLPRDPVTGRALPFGSDPGAPERPPRKLGSTEALASEDPNAKFGRIDSGQLAGYIAACEMLLGGITAQTRVPGSYYGLGARSNTSGQTVKASETGLEQRKVDVQRYLGSSYRRMVSDAVSADLGRPVRLAPRWANTETHDEASDADAAGKYVSAGLDLRSVLKRIGWPQALIDEAMARAGAEREAAALLLQGIDARLGAGGSGSTGLDPADPADPAAVPAPRDPATFLG